MLLPNAHVWTAAELAEYRQLYRLRAHLEAFAARCAAANTAHGISTHALAEFHRQMISAARAGDYTAFAVADRAFHREITILARTPTLTEMREMMAERMQPFVEWGYRHIFHDLTAIAVAHQPFVDAICAGRPREAARLAESSLDALWQILDEPSLAPAGGGDPVERSCIYILLNLDQHLTLSFLAEQVAHLSPGHLARRFRQERGESYRAFLQRARLRRAASLLAETELPVQEIAERVGYADPSRFATHFRRHFGCAPRQRREK